MILSHRIALALLDRKNRDLPARRPADVQFEVPGGKVGRRLERFVALAARLARLGSRDLPLPGRLHRLALPLPRVADEAGAWVGTGPAGAGGLKEPAPAWLRSNRKVTASTPAPSRAVSVAALGARVGGAQSAAVVAGRQTRRPREAPLGVRAAALQTRETGLPALQPRSALAAVQAAAVAPGGGGVVLIKQGPGPRVLSAALPMRAGGRVSGNGGAVPAETSRSAPAHRLVSAGGLGSGRAAVLEIMHRAQAKAAHPAMPAGSALPSATGSALTGAAALPGATSIPPLEVPASGSTRGARQRPAVLQGSVVSLPRTESRQDILRRQVVPPTGLPGRLAASSAERTMHGGVGSQQAASSPAVAEGGFGADSGRTMMMSLTGDVMMDGRRLGQVAASSQASRASLPAHGPSRVNLRAVPIHSGMQIPQ